MVKLIRSLDLVAAMVLEATVIYVDSEFNDVLSANACFALFVGFTIHLLWRASLFTELVAPSVLVWVCKLRLSLNLTPHREALFSEFCSRKDGKVV